MRPWPGASTPSDAELLRAPDGAARASPCPEARRSWLDRWVLLTPDQPLSFLRGQLLALAVMAVAAGVRWAALPYIGETSFIVGAPAILVAALLGGLPAGVTTLALGSALDLMFSTAFGRAPPEHAWLRFAVWLASAAFIMAISLALRSMLLRLRARERALTAAGEQMQVLVEELEHRGRNALAVIQALSNQTARSAASVDDYRTELAQRLQALAKSYSNLTRRASDAVELSGLVGSTLEPFGSQVRILGGPGGPIPEKARTPLILLLHELATNATKYGALSTPSGRVAVGWSEAPDGFVELSWVERGGPPPKPSTREGFGSKLLKAVVTALPGASFEAAPGPEGMSFHVRFRAKG